MPDQALTGIRVIDLSHYIAGSYCTKILADNGAEVIKVEKPGPGDGARRIGPYPGDDPDPEKSGLFLHLNTSKKSITLNLRSSTGRAIFKKLVGEADALVENFTPRVMPSLGLDYGALEKINPRLVMTSISNFGPTGPYRDYKATDIVEYAMGGWMYATGDPDKPPLQAGGSYCQYIAGQSAVIGTVSALLWARWTGVGQQVQLSIMEAVISVLCYDTVSYAYTGVGRPRLGHTWGLSPAASLILGQSIQPCRDGHIMFCVGMRDQVWEDFFTVMLGKPELLQDPRFQDPLKRREHDAELQALAREWLGEHDSEEIFHTAQALRFPFGLMATTEDIMNSPQHEARGFFVDIEHPKAGTLTYTGAPFKMSETPWQVRRAPPLLGQHNEEVYGSQLGFSKEEMVRLRETGVI